MDSGTQDGSGAPGDGGADDDDAVAAVDGSGPGGSDGAGTLDGEPDDGATADAVDAPVQGGSGGAGGTGGTGGTASACAAAAAAPVAFSGAGTLTWSGTLAGTSSLRPQTAGCGAGSTGPEVVYALDLPAGQLHVQASTVSAATTADTLVYLQSVCGGGSELACNDDVGGPGPSTISAAVMGPRRLYLVVDSMATVPQPPADVFELSVTVTVPDPAGAPCTPVAPGTLDPCVAGQICPPSGGQAATCTSPTAPVIDAVELFARPDEPAGETMLFLSAHDAEGDWSNLRLVFRSQAGMALDWSDHDVSELWGQAAVFEVPFELSVPAGTAAVEVTARDSRSLASAPAGAVLTSWADLGEGCNPALAAPDQCRYELVCVGAACAASSQAASACAGADAITLGTPVSGTAAELTADTFEGSCRFERRGHDRVFRATLPALPANAVAWDLLASTATSGGPYQYATQLDTYLFIRSACTDPASELACHDDLSALDLRSQAVAMNLAPGDYHVVLDTSSPDQNGSSVAYTLLVRGRAVMSSGAACDPAGVASRCQAGICPALSAVCP